MSDNRLYNTAVKHKLIVTAQTIVLRSGQSKLHRVTVTFLAVGTVIIYNSSSGSGDAVAVINNNNAGTLEYGGIILPLGLTVVTDSAANVNIIYE